MKTQYRGYTLVLGENENGYYVMIKDKGNVHIDSSPYRNDIESAFLAAQNLLDSIVTKIILR